VRAMSPERSLDCLDFGGCDRHPRELEPESCHGRRPRRCNRSPGDLEELRVRRICDGKGDILCGSKHIGDIVDLSVILVDALAGEAACEMAPFPVAPSGGPDRYPFLDAARRPGFRF